jgi:hypothetical protein
MPILIKTGKITDILQDLQAFLRAFWAYISKYLSDRKMFQTDVVQKLRTHSTTITFFRTESFTDLEIIKKCIFFLPCHPKTWESLDWDFYLIHHQNQTNYATGRETAQAVNRRFSTAAAQIQSQIRSCGICGGQSGAGAGSLRVLRISLPILIAPAATHSVIILSSNAV